MYLHDNITLFYNFVQDSCATINSCSDNDSILFFTEYHA